MHYYEVAPNQIVRTNSAFFTYASDSELAIGTIVIIEVGKKSMLGVILREATKPTYDTKPIESVVESYPLPSELTALAVWMSTYYDTHLALVLQTILPQGIRKNRRIKKLADHTTTRKRTNIIFTEAQKHALSTVESMGSGSAILHGVTGSGKTSVYIEVAKQALQAEKSAIILVPEIALTSQVVDDFSHHFTDIILTHSKQTEAERHLAWKEALTSTTPRIVIGPRSALFLPLKDIGLIVIDEAHEPSFKQEQSPRYSALRAASILANEHKAKLLLGSATPLISDYYLAQHANRPIIAMDERAQKNAVKPRIKLVDMTKRASFKKHRFLSDLLIAEISLALENGNQALIFHNRRGSASTTLCENCGWAALCPRCFVPFTLHADTHKLRCHICDNTQKVPTHCPVCSSVDVVHKGIGTKLIEAEVQKLFPNKKVARFDGDSQSGESLDKRYHELYDGTIDIIIGTQIIAKGLDLPHLRTVGVIQADAGLSLPDYSSSERTFQLLAQVVGRVGRSHHPTSVVVQSYQPTHPAISYGLNQDYAGFYATALAARKAGLFPPFTYLLKLTCIYKTEAVAIKNAQSLAHVLREKSKDVQILGPTPAFYERQHDTYRWQLILKSPSRAALVALLQYLPPTHWQFELDPTSLL